MADEYHIVNSNDSDCHINVKTPAARVSQRPSSLNDNNKEKNHFIGKIIFISCG